MTSASFVAAVSVLVGCTVILQGCSAIVTGQSPPACTLCERPDVQGPNASPLNKDDFQEFCDSCTKLERHQRVEKAAATRERQTAEVLRTGKSPPNCDLCKRDDVIGPAAGDMYNDDFKTFCTACGKLWGTEGLEVPAARGPLLTAALLAANVPASQHTIGLGYASLASGLLFCSALMS